MLDHAPILLAEDEENDAFLFRIALEKAGIPNPLVVVTDGRQAIQYLNGDPPYTDRTQHRLPALLLLDLNMPVRSGFDVLAWLRDRPEFKALPAVVLTSSEYDQDKERARQLGASAYHIKPGTLRNLQKLVQDLHARWLTPPPPNHSCH
jgi:CheY-like chemotaxis protein